MSSDSKDHGLTVQGVKSNRCFRQTRLFCRLPFQCRFLPTVGELHVGEMSAVGEFMTYFTHIVSETFAFRLVKIFWELNIIFYVV